MHTHLSVSVNFHEALNILQFSLELLLGEDHSQVIWNAVKPTGGHQVHSSVHCLLVVPLLHQLHELQGREVRGV